MGCGAQKSVEVKNPKKEEEEQKEEQKEEEKIEEQKEEEKIEEQKEEVIQEQEQYEDNQEKEKEQELEEQNDFNGSGEEEEIHEDIDYNQNEIEENNLKSQSNEKSNSNIYKTKQKLHKNKPFIISEIEKSPNKRVKLIVNASSFVEEYMMPIWCPKDIYLKFKVKGKWKIDKLSEYTDSRGLLSSHYDGFNFGALIGRVGFGNSFVVADKGTILVKEEGPLFLRQNLPRKIKIEPEGKLEITVYDGEFVELEDIYKNIGWKENQTIEHIMKDENNENKKDENNSKKNTNKELEKKLRNYFNNLRMNPTLFYERYIIFNQSLKMLKKFLEKKNGKKILSLAENEDCYKFLEDYINSLNQNEIMKNINNNRISEYLPKMEEDIAYYLSEQIGTPVKVKTILTKKSIPNDIIIQLLLDKNYRSYIFNDKSQSLTIKTFKNIINDLTLIIIVISLEKEKNQEDFN